MSRWPCAVCAESAICRSSLAVAAAGRRTIWGYRQLDKFFSLEIHTHNCVCIKKGSVGRHVQQRVAHTHTNYSQSTARWSWRRRKVIINVCVMEVGQKMKSNRAVSLSPLFSSSFYSLRLHTRPFVAPLCVFFSSLYLWVLEICDRHDRDFYFKRKRCLFVCFFRCQLFTLLAARCRFGE